MDDIIKEQFSRNIQIHEASKERLISDIGKAAEIIIAALAQGKKILLCGNGGSAADAQHIAAEFVGRFQKERDALPAIALTADTSVITAIANDYGYERIFARQIQALGKQGDVFVAISTSGNSANVVLGAEAAREKGLRVVAFLGNDGGKLKDLADVALVVPAQETPRIQEVHILIGHIVCRLVEENYARIK